ncbi:TPA: replication protein [Providencia alcalifaciens]|uniref:replication protein n=1 Tax=Providencia alcalifaciens TaxID=126385 RepID=UPI001CC3D285|nr:replication protein [Providencia alcalifaciens]CAG9418471.1 hypothetical protein NVI2019_NGLDDFDA_01629 [Providencia alcalifaciens]
MSAEIKYLDDFRPELKVVESKVADLDNGYTRIVNELLEAVMLANLTQHQLLVFFAIARKTYGYNKKSDWIGNEQLSKLTGMLPHKCSAAKSELVSRGILLAEKRHVSINKNIHEWKEKQVYPKKVSLPKLGKETLPESGKSDYPNQVNTKDNITKDNKDNIPLTPEGENIALEILDYYNQLTNSKFQSTAPILKALNTVKSKGECYTPDEIKLVMKWAVKTWTKGKDLKPQNLCRMTRFDGYLSDALKWKNREGINPVDCPHEELIKIWNRYIPERAIELHEWTPRRPAYKDLEAVWNGKTNKGQWREIQHMDTCFRLISQSSHFTNLGEKGYLTLDWILTPARWSQTYEQAKREYAERKKGI